MMGLLKCLIKKMLPETWKQFVRFCRNGNLWREHQAFEAGQRMYFDIMNDLVGKAMHPEFRRSIHRIEKGLINKPIRNVFGVEYIEQTVLMYKALMARANQDEVTQRMGKWAHDVLCEYFKNTTSHPIIDKARLEFNKISHDNIPESPKHIPYYRDLSPLKVNYEQMLALAQRRRSVRWFLQKPVPRKMVDRALEIANLSPSACNRQSFEFRIYDAPALVKQVAALPVGFTGFCEQTPMFVVLVGRLRPYVICADRHLIYIDASLAAMSFSFGLEVQGLSSCMINWADHFDREQQLVDLIGLEHDERVIMCMAVGFPDPKGLVPYSQKKTLSEIRSYNRIFSGNE